MSRLINAYGNAFLFSENLNYQKKPYSDKLLLKGSVVYTSICNSHLHEQNVFLLSLKYLIGIQKHCFIDFRLCFTLSNKSKRNTFLISDITEAYNHYSNQLPAYNLNQMEAFGVRKAILMFFRFISTCFMLRNPFDKSRTFFTILFF